MAIEVAWQAEGSIIIGANYNTGLQSVQRFYNHFGAQRCLVKIKASFEMGQTTEANIADGNIGRIRFGFQ